jgi:hypothetical protein
VPRVFGFRIRRPPRPAPPLPNGGVDDGNTNTNGRPVEMGAKGRGKRELTSDDDDDDDDDGGGGPLKGSPRRGGGAGGKRFKLEPPPKVSLAVA